MRRFLNVLVIFVMLIPSISIASANDFGFWKKKKKKQAKIEETKKSDKKKSSLKKYDDVIKSDAVTKTGVIDIHRVGKDYYFEIKNNLIDRDFLIVNKISKVSSEVNGLGLNKGINYQNLVVRFEKDTINNKVFVRTYKPNYEAKEGDAIALSFKDNYISSMRESFDLECLGKDSTSFVIKVNKIFDGSKNSLNKLFTILGISSSANTSLSKIESFKSFPKNVVVKSLLTTQAEGITVSMESTVNLVLLPVKPMTPRFADERVGYFTTDRTYYSDSQHELEERQLVNRWRLEPKDEDVQKYLNGELVEPKKQIVFYIDPATPRQWVKSIKDGIFDWQKAFEKAGFKNAIIAKDAPVDDPDFDGDDVRYSMITYAASSQANAMGPSVVDPRSGEIIEADVVWWHNVMTALHSWIRIQTGAIDPKARANKFTDEHMAHAIRFVSSHEVGHTLGLMHNMGASYSYPVDSLRSPSFTANMATAPSIMDYARFNYVAQPGDGVKNITPQIGIYDKYAIAWAYRWYDVKTPWQELPFLSKEIRKHENDPLYHYGPQQSGKNTIDPSAQSEDLGDNSMKASSYGLKNLKRISKEIENWSCEEGANYTKAGKMMMGIIGQWFMYANHVVANVGGIYLDRPVYGETKKAYVHVEKQKQKEAIKYLIDNVFNLPTWLSNAEIYDKTYPIKESAIGDIEYAPTTMFRDLHARIYYSLLKKTRITRMLENEAANGSNAYTVANMMNDLYKGIFRKTINGRKLGVYDRQTQKNYVDALIVCQNKAVEKYHKNKIDGLDNISDCACCGSMPTMCSHGDHYANSDKSQTHLKDRNIFYSTMNRVSDDVSIKRGELRRILSLLKKRQNIADTATKYHYQDLILRIENTLKLNK